MLENSLLRARLLRDEPLAKYTAARLGGPADYLFIAQNIGELSEAAKAAWNDEMPVRILGGGANVLVSDAGVRGLVIINNASGTYFRHNTPDIPDLEGKRVGQPSSVYVTSGTSLTVLARKCQSRGLAGFEWAASVPGTIGGAVVNNAGAHGGDIAGSVGEVGILDTEHGEYSLTPAKLNYGYRTSSLKTRTDKRFVVLWAHLDLTIDDPAKVAERLNANVAYRKRTQPPGASLGSIFKNPPDDYAGRLIESAGLKGYTIGGAQVSPIHANFFINTGSATASDYFALVQYVQSTVHTQTGIMLEPEIEIVGKSF